MKRKRWLVGALGTVVATAAASAIAQTAVDPWLVAQNNGQQSRRAIELSRRYAQAWLQHIDSASGLLPRRIDRADQWYWSIRDCAGDYYSALVLAGEITGDNSLRLISRNILEQETKLTRRIDSLPDDFDFSTQRFRSATPDAVAVMWGASIYCQAGLLPIVEWVEPGPWSNRLSELMVDLRKQSADGAAGGAAQNSMAIDGALLQAACRMYWISGDDHYKEWAFKLADRYLMGQRLVDEPLLILDGAGSELISGLSEAYVLAHANDPARYEKYKPEMHSLLDFILRHGLDGRGLIVDAIDAHANHFVTKASQLSSVFHVLLIVADLDRVERFRDPVIHLLADIGNITFDSLATAAAAHEGSTAGSPANLLPASMPDSLENWMVLLNRYPLNTATDWLDARMAELMGQQRADGFIEGYGESGRPVRAAMMYAFYKTQGISAIPWRNDLQMGASRDRDGVVRVFIQSDFPWTGRLRFDRPRHRDFLHLPMDYPRRHQFPEWFTVQAEQSYELTLGETPAKVVAGKELFDWPMTVTPGSPVRMTVRPMPDPSMKSQPTAAKANEAPSAMTQPVNVAPQSANVVQPPAVTTQQPADAVQKSAVVASQPATITPPPQKIAEKLPTQDIASQPTLHPTSQPASQPTTMTSRPASLALRTMRYSSRSKAEAVAWQNDVRSRLFDALKISDLFKMSIPLAPRPLSAEIAEGGAYSIREVEFNSTRKRRITAIVTVPRLSPSEPAMPEDWLADPRLRSKEGQPIFPAVVCIHGHGGDRHSTYDAKSIYKGFAARLAADGFVTIAIDVGQHTLADPDRTLPGERLWDLIRCVDLLQIMPEVDENRIGCAGLSLGGEMAMWLGAMDPRIYGTVSSGFLTRMDQMEKNHCMCWKFPGLRELVDFADIFSLIAPRPLQCQNGIAESADQFPVFVAINALREIMPIYKDFGMPERIDGLVIHAGGHEVDVDPLLAFFDKYLGKP